MLRNNLFFFVPFALAIGLLPFVFNDVFGAEIPHYNNTITTLICSGSSCSSSDNPTVYTDIIGATIDSGNFTTGNKYLILLDGYIRMDGVTRMDIQALHGSTVFPDSIQLGDRVGFEWATYSWFTVWTAVSGEGIKLQWKSSSANNDLRMDEYSLISIEISEDLTENTDWFYDNVTASTALTTSWSTSNNAEITFTPSETSDWLVMTNDVLHTTSITSNYEHRINSTGTITEVQPEISREGESSSEELVKHLYRPYTLDAESNTFTAESRNDAETSGTREFSKVFALNLENFVDNEYTWIEAQKAYTGLVFNTNLDSDTITPTSEGDFFVTAGYVLDTPDISGFYTDHRIQVDNIDLIDGTTAEDYQKYNPADLTDEIRYSQTSILNLDTSAHTIDSDAGCFFGCSSRQAEDRNIVVFSMELVSSGTVFEQDLDDLVTYGDFLNVTLDAGAVVFEQDLDDLVTYGDFISTLLLNEISTNMTDQVTYGDDVRLVIAIPSNMTDQVFYADFVNITLNVGGAPGGPIIPVPGVTPQGLSLIEWIVYGFFAYGAMLMLMIGIVKEIPGTRTTSLLRIVFILPGIIGAGMLAGPYETIIFPTVDTVNAITLTTENFTETIITTSYIQLQNPVWIIFHYALMAVMIIYTLSQVLTMLTTAPLEANRNKGNV